MDHAALMRIVERPPHDADRERDRLDRLRALGTEDLVESAPFDELHREERERGILADRVDRHDVRVAQRRRHPCLASKALERVGRGRGRHRHDLDRDLAFERDLGGAEDRRHAARAELGVDLIASRRRRAEAVDEWGLAGRGGGGGCGHMCGAGPTLMTSRRCGTPHCARSGPSAPVTMRPARTMRIRPVVRRRGC